MTTPAPPTTVVRYTVDTPRAVRVPGAAVEVALMRGGQLATADVVVAGSVQIVARLVTDSVGEFAVPLIPNTAYRQPDTYYRVRVAAAEYTIRVPAAGPVRLWDCRIDPTTLLPPPMQPPPGVVLRDEVGAPNGVATLGADGVLTAAQRPPGGGGGGVTDHGALTGLGDDDHDVRYYPRGDVDTAIAGRVPTSRTVTAGTGLSGGGALTADRTLTVAYGATSTTACRGDDPRLSDSRA
ncbi:MAG: hypothetical protein ACRCZP_01945, partial [Phycicoccus sp.]